MTFIRRLIQGVRRQIAIVLAIADYDLDRRSTGSSLGSWEGIINPMQLMLFFIVMRVGFSFLRGPIVLLPAVRRICISISFHLLRLDLCLRFFLGMWQSRPLLG